MSTPSTQEANAIVGLAGLGYSMQEIEVARHCGLRAAHVVRQVMAHLNNAGAPPETYDRAHALLLSHAARGFKASSADEILESLTGRDTMSSE